MPFVRHPKILHKHCFRFLLEVKMTPRETENNAYAKFWGDKQRALWYVMIFSVVVNCRYDLSQGIESFHSRDQHLCKFMRTKESVYIRKEINSHRTGLEHQHGHRFSVLEHQYGRSDLI